MKGEPKEEYITQDPKKDPIAEDPKEDCMTEDLREGPVTKVSKQDPNNSKKQILRQFSFLFLIHRILRIS